MATSWNKKMFNILFKKKVDFKKRFFFISLFHLTFYYLFQVIIFLMVYVDNNPCITWGGGSQMKSL